MNINNYSGLFATRTAALLFETRTSITDSTLSDCIKSAATACRYDSNSNYSGTASDNCVISKILQDIAK